MRQYQDDFKQVSTELNNLKDLNFKQLAESYQTRNINNHNKFTTSRMLKKSFINSYSWCDNKNILQEAKRAPIRNKHPTECLSQQSIIVEQLDPVG
jgi:hypothetical protein